MSDSEYRKFVQSVIDNVKKNGFPEKKVAFSIEQLYEAAYKKDINFNRVLETLEEIEICHEKTPEKIIFFPRKDKPEPGIGEAFQSALHNIDPSALGNMNPSDMMTFASQMMQNLSPEQIESLKKMYENMSDEDRAAIVEQAKKLGMI